MDSRCCCTHTYNFNSLAPRGGRSCGTSTLLFRLADFNSLAPRGAIHFYNGKSAPFFPISTHSPRGGRSSKFSCSECPNNDFNSLAPRGGRSGRGRARSGYVLEISTHSPRGERSYFFSPCFNTSENFNSLAPRGGRSPSSPVRYQLIADFNSLAPRGAIRDLGVMRLASRIFQLTRSARGDPKFSYLSPYIMRISTHSPRGGDPVPLPESSIPPPSTR